MGRQIGYMSTDKFISKLANIHGNNYDYSSTVYMGSNKPITYKCYMHGDITQIARTHMSGSKCPHCGYEKKRNIKTRITKEEFISRSNKKFGNLFDYSKSVIDNTTNMFTKIIIICKVHGEFEQTLSNHLSSKFGCSKCRDVEVGKKFALYYRETYGSYVDRFKKIHGNKYDYSNVDESVGCKTKVKIVCPIHGDFYQTLEKHLMHGCSKCSSSHGESKVREWLIKNNIAFVEQKRFDNCRNKKPLPFDFYIESLNICIEYDGEFHYKTMDINNEETLRYVQSNDLIKNNFCLNTKIKLIRIPYWEFNNIDSLLNGELLC